MTGPMLAGVLNQVRNLQAAQVTDGELLHQFVATQDEAAFSMIVDRYGPLVMRVCRHRLADSHAAEDAFQATFLVLARKAGSVRPEGLGCWLHGVATNVARRSNRPMPALVHDQVTVMGSSTDPVAEITLRDALAVLDEELGRLPEKQRLPLVLCYLEEKTRDEAARQLGWPEGTFKRRLERGREMLRQRLTRRGLALSAGLVAMLLTGGARASVPTALKLMTLQRALLLGSGKALGELATEPVGRLVEGVLSTMTGKLNWAALVSLVLIASALGMGVAVQTFVQPEASSARSQLSEPDQATPALPRVDAFGDPLPDRALARLGTTRARHGDDLFMVGFADQGKALVTGSLDGTLAVWEARSGQELRRLGKVPIYQDVGRVRLTRGRDTIVYTPPAARVTAALSPDGGSLAVSDLSGTVRIWDTATGKMTVTFQAAEPKEATGFAISLVFAPDGKALITKGGDQVFKEWDPATGKELRTYGKPGTGRRDSYLFGAAESVAVSPDGKLMAAGSILFENNQITNVLKLWDRATGQELKTLSDELQLGLASVAFSPNGKLLVWAGRNWTVHRWDVAGERALPPIRHQAYNQPVALAFAPDSKTLAIKQADEVVTLWDVQEAKERARLGHPVSGPHPVRNIMETHLVTPGAVAFAPDGKSLALAGSNHSVCLWDVAQGKEIFPLGGHQGAVTAVVLAADGTTLTSWGTDNVVRRWDHASGKPLAARPPTNAAGPAAFSGDGRRVAYGASDGALRVCDVGDGQEIFAVPGRLPSTDLLGMGIGRGLALSRDGTRLALLEWDQTVRLWDVASGKELPRLSDPSLGGNPPILIAPGPRSDPVEMAFSPDGTLLAAIAAAPDLNDRLGRKVNASVALWNLKTSKLVRRLDETASPVAVAFAADGRSLVTASADGSVRLHELLTGREQAQFKTDPFRGGVALALSRDGRVLATGGFRAPYIRLWDVCSGKELAQVGEHRGAVRTLNFTADAKTLISGGADTTLVAWDVAALTAAPIPAALTDAAVAALWDELASADAGKALRAMFSLRGAPQQAIAVARRQLKPAMGIEAKLLEQWLADLGSDEFARRRVAEGELALRADLVAAALEKVLIAKPSLEVSQRIERLLEQAHGGGTPAPGLAQAIRAVQMLEQLGTTEAKEILRAVAQGAPGARLTLAAVAALDRLEQHAKQ